jgi:L,D-transpeptidase ErfK/SrfK
MMKRFFFGLFLSTILIQGGAYAAGYNYQLMSKDISPLKWKTVIGWTNQHVISNGETMLDIARNYELGWNEIEILYPDVDPWIPDAGTELQIPVCWILPSGNYDGIVINIPELRLYRYIPETNLVETYPVGIGTEEYQTPLGEYQVVDREEKPVWMVPPSLREKYSFTYMPPGPHNPLGDYWLGLSAKHIGIHGTNFPWAVGRQVSRGCIRLYPEHIERLFPEVALGTRVHIIYEPVKFGVLDGDIYIEVHPDTDGITSDLQKYVIEHLQELGDGCYVSHERLEKALQEKNGVPIRIGSIQGGGDDEALHAAQEEGYTPKEAIN